MRAPGPRETIIGLPATAKNRPWGMHPIGAHPGGARDRPRPAPRHSHAIQILARYHASRLHPLGPTGRFELDLLAFGERPKPLPLYGREMDEHISAAIARRYKTKTLRFIKPLHGTGLHRNLFFDYLPELRVDPVSASVPPLIMLAVVPHATFQGTQNLCYVNRARKTILSCPVNISPWNPRILPGGR